MIEIVIDEGFKRSYKKIIKNNPLINEKFKDKLELFVSDPYHPFLKTHKLSGSLKHLHAFTVEYDLRVVFKFLDSSTALLIDIGTHESVY